MTGTNAHGWAFLVGGFLLVAFSGPLARAFRDYARFRGPVGRQGEPQDWYVLARVCLLFIGVGWCGMGAALLTGAGQVGMAGGPPHVHLIPTPPPRRP